MKTALSTRNDRQAAILLHELDRARRYLQWRRLCFYIVVVIPTITAAIFYTALASKRYVSEVQFVVRSISNQRATGLDIFFRTFGLSKTVDDGYAVQRYLQSRDVLRELISSLPLAKIFQVPEADYLSRYPYFWRTDSFESLYDYFLQRVTVTEDSVKGIIELRVTSFRPEDSHIIATTMVRLAEQMVNRMNERARRDAVQNARDEVERAQANVLESQSRITSFRNTEMLVDPSKASISVIELIGNLSSDLSTAIANVRELEASSPSSPSLGPMRSRVSSLEETIRSERKKLAGNDDALASKISTYEQLTLKRNLADKILTAAMNSLDSAQQESRRQAIYIEEISSPNYPDESIEPRRIRSTLTVLVLGIAVFCIIWIVSVGANEHSQ